MFGVSELSASIVIAGLVAVISFIAFNRLRRLQRWRILASGMECQYPNKDVLMDFEALGKFSVVEGPGFGHVRTICDESGVCIAKMAGYFRYPSFRIPWTDVKAIVFTGIVYPARYGTDYCGLAKVTLVGHSSYALLIPWRGLFAESVPSSVSLESTQVVHNAS